VSRRQLIEKIDSLDRQLGLRAEVISLVSQHAQHTLGCINPAWLLGSGALAGVLANRLGIGSTYTLGMTGVRLFPLAQNAFYLGRNFGAGE